MVAVLSLILLLSISFLALRYTFVKKPYLVKSPWEKRFKMYVNQKQRFILFLLATAIIQVDSYSSILLFIWMVCLIILLLQNSTKVSTTPLTITYTLYLLWLFISLFRTPETVHGIRVFAKYLFPFLVFLVANSTKTNKSFFNKLLNVSFMSGVIVNCLIILMKIIPISSIYRAIFWWPPAVIDANPFFIATGIIIYSQTKKKIILFYILLIFCIPFIENVRTGIVGITVFLLAASFFKYKLKSLPLFLFIFIGLVVSITYVSSIRNKMFSDGFGSANELISSSNNISILDINTNGRSVLWEWVLDKYYYGNELVGSGLGQVQGRLYLGDLFGGIKVVHNDFIQILCDTGNIGLLLYLTTLISFIWHAFRIYNNKTYSISARNSAFIAGTSLCGILASAFTDNVVNYSLITLSYPFVFFGCALSLKKHKNSDIHEN